MIALLGDQPSLSSKIMRGAEGADKRCGQPMQSAERSEEHTSELQSRLHLVCRLLLEKKQNELHKCYCKNSDRSDPPITRAKVTGNVLTLDEALKTTIPPLLCMLEPIT